MGHWNACPGSLAWLLPTLISLAWVALGCRVSQRAPCRQPLLFPQGDESAPFFKNKSSWVAREMQGCCLHFLSCGLVSGRDGHRAPGVLSRVGWGRRSWPLPMLPSLNGALCASELSRGSGGDRNLCLNVALLVDVVLKTVGGSNTQLAGWLRYCIRE